ncbi:unnamed protein product, partial [Pylaiella littoralis]
DRLLAEARPYDLLWGIGIPASHPHAAHPSKWKGAQDQDFGYLE